MLFLDFRFVRSVDSNPIYEADVTNGEVAEAIDNGDLVLARFPIVRTSGPITRTIGYENITSVFYTKVPAGGELAWTFDFYSPHSAGSFVTGSEASAATDKVVVSLAS